jgi:SAM-dependent methyltransferase
MISDPHTSPTMPSLNGLGPCGQPCDHPCDQQPCEEKQAKQSRWAHWLKASLFNTLDVCFDDVYREPKKILIVGGCRQMDLSQHIALLLPAAEITLVDADEAVVERAKEEICCRFKFVHSPLEGLPFDTEQFDLTIAHNFFAYPHEWQRAMSEIGRVTSDNLFLSVHRPLLWKLSQRIGGIAQGMSALGIEIPNHLPETYEFMRHFTQYAKIKTKLAPFPWTVFMSQVRPKWDEKLILAS